MEYWKLRQQELSRCSNVEFSIGHERTLDIRKGWRRDVRISLQVLIKIELVNLEM